MIESTDPIEALTDNVIASSGIRFLSYDTLVEHGSFPVCPYSNSLTVDLNRIERDESLLVFISHRWLRGNSKSAGWNGTPHPDNAAGDKFKLCVEGIKQLKNNVASRMSHCYVWMDYCCMNQDIKDLSGELERYDTIVANCDCIFTPIVCQSATTEDIEVNMNSYLNRAWCRVEMTYAAHIPLLYDVDNDGFRRYSKFDKGLSFHLCEGRRPHYGFTPRHIQYSSPPHLFIPFMHAQLSLFPPVNGDLSNESDRLHINRLMEDLKPLITAKSLSCGYIGPTNHLKQKEGFGKEIYSDGRVYEGDWQMNMRHGYGSDRLYTEVYEGFWRYDKKHGWGRFTTITHDYVGDFAYDLKHGKGRWKGINGDVYSGDFVNDQRTGYGTYRYASDSTVYVGQWLDNKKHGFGFFIGGSIMYKGNFQNNEMHGGGTYYNDGLIFEGVWDHGKLLHVISSQQLP